MERERLGAASLSTGQITAFDLAAKWPSSGLGFGSEPRPPSAGVIKDGD